MQGVVWFDLDPDELGQIDPEGQGQTAPESRRGDLIGEVTGEGSGESRL